MRSPLTSRLASADAYSLAVFDFCGWDPKRETPIQVDDPVPPQPWIACNLTDITSAGGGRGEVKLKTLPILFVTHHSMSRAAQRIGVRTAHHLIGAVEAIWTAAFDFMLEKGRLAEWLDAPPQGWRVPIIDGSGAIVVLKRHEERKALIAATVLNQRESKS